MRYKDIKGMKFGRLIVVEYYGADKHKNALWECQCDCGNTSIAKTHNLMKGATRSCGCLQKEKATKHLLDISTTHGLSKDSKGKNTRLFRIWMGIKNRCSNSNLREYPKYGGRGIKICDKWLNDYKAFHDWSIQNGYSEKLSIDRIDNDGNYEPSNCRWVDEKTQANNRSSSKIYEINGVKRTLAEWVKEYNCSYPTAYERLKRGWSLQKALTKGVN